MIQKLKLGIIIKTHNKVNVYVDQCCAMWEIFMGQL